jgi:hypothetical protein
MASFVDALSARSAVGIDARGRLVLAQLDGRSWHTGISLPAFAAWLGRRCAWWKRSIWTAAGARP